MNPMVKEEMKKCPYCAEMIKADAIKCRYCKSNLNRKAFDFLSTKGYWHRVNKGKKIAGVCTGLAAQFDTPILILPLRIFFILTTIFYGFGLILYIILWLLMPPPVDIPGEKKHVERSASGSGEPAAASGGETKQNHATNVTMALGLALVCILIFLLFFAGFRFGEFGLISINNSPFRFVNSLTHNVMYFPMWIGQALIIGIFACIVALFLLALKLLFGGLRIVLGLVLLLIGAVFLWPVFIPLIGLGMVIFVLGGLLYLFIVLPLKLLLG